MLSQSSVLELDNKGQMISSLIKVSDLSFIDDGEVVSYKFVAENLDQEVFKNKVYNSKKVNKIFQIGENSITFFQNLIQIQKRSFIF